MQVFGRVSERLRRTDSCAVLRTGGLVIASVAVFAILNAVQIMRVSATSMEPGIRSRDVLLVVNLAWLMGPRWFDVCPPGRRQLIVFRSPLPSGETMLKRVVAVPGDRIRITDGGVILNGRSQVEPYVALAAGETPSGTHETISASNRNDLLVLDGRVFVLGDNRRSSIDSRNFGTVPMAEIVGIVVAVVPGRTGG